MRYLAAVAIVVAPLAYVLLAKGPEAPTSEARAIVQDEKPGVAAERADEEALAELGPASERTDHVSQSVEDVTHVPDEDAGRGVVSDAGVHRTSPVEALEKAYKHVQSMPQGSAYEEAEAENVLLIVSIRTILDARGDFEVSIPGEQYWLDSDPLPPDTYLWVGNGRRYRVAADEFPELREITELLGGQGQTTQQIDPHERGTHLDQLLRDQIALRYEEALGVARSMAD